MTNRLTKEQLETYKNTYDHFDGITENEFDAICDELIGYKQLAEEIGCPLDFVATPYKLSGLKKIWYHNQWCEVVRIVVYEEATKPYMEVRCKDYKYLKMILLEDYGKTWFLDKKELPTQNGE